ncbi:hypothetical protein EMIT047CA2_40242 [Pseudomonas soli]
MRAIGCLEVGNAFTLALQALNHLEKGFHDGELGSLPRHATTGVSRCARQAVTELGDCRVRIRQELQRGESSRGIMAAAPLEPHVPDVARNLR